MRDLAETSPPRIESDFVGRQTELDRLDRTARLSLRGVSGTVLIEGHRRVGKTRLVEEFARRSAAQGWEIYHGRWESEQRARASRHFEFFRDTESRGAASFRVSAAALTSPDASIARGEIIRQRLEDELGGTEARIPRANLSQGGEVSRQARSPDDMIEGSGVQRPILLVADDLRRSDTSSWLLIRALASGFARTPSMLIAIFDATNLAGTRSFRKLFADVTAPEILVVNPLARAEVEQLVAVISGEAPSEDTVDLIWTASKGMPQAVRELSRLLAAKVKQRSVHSSTSRQALNGTRAAAASLDSFTREGEYWTIVFRGRVLRLRHSKGLGYIAQLTSDPERPIHALDLAVPRRGSSDSASEVRPAGSFAIDPDSGRAGSPSLDRQAREEYKRRLEDLEEDLIEATTFNDRGRIERLSDEKQFLLRELSRSFGLNGRQRNSGSAGERARVSVTHAIRAAIARIAHDDRELARHFSLAIQTGIYCCYKPDQAPSWNSPNARGE